MPPPAGWPLWPRGLSNAGGQGRRALHSLAGNHALVDGNKRLAWLATADFLWINGYLLDMTDDEAFDLTMLVAAGQLDAAGIEKRLRLVPKTG